MERPLPTQRRNTRADIHDVTGISLIPVSERSKTGECWHQTWRVTRWVKCGFSERCGVSVQSWHWQLAIITADEQLQFRKLCERQTAAASDCQLGGGPRQCSVPQCASPQGANKVLSAEVNHGARLGVVRQVSWKCQTFGAIILRTDKGTDQGKTRHVSEFVSVGGDSLQRNTCCKQFNLMGH
jgi:hypothetical protein